MNTKSLHTISIFGCHCDLVVYIVIDKVKIIEYRNVTAEKITPPIYDKAFQSNTLRNPNRHNKKEQTQSLLGT